MLDTISGSANFIAVILEILLEILSEIWSAVWARAISRGTGDLIVLFMAGIGATWLAYRLVKIILVIGAAMTVLMAARLYLAAA